MTQLTVIIAVVHLLMTWAIYCTKKKYYCWTIASEKRSININSFSGFYNTYLLILQVSHFLTKYTTSVLVDNIQNQNSELTRNILYQFMHEIKVIEVKQTKQGMYQEAEQTWSCTTSHAWCEYPHSNCKFDIRQHPKSLTIYAHST